ncbi:UDP-galactopyranose mutase [Candidatus Pelagibacter sp.]|nr:UDP-galactopyranose mutase [Candidatus Pelagibacter sp.]
MNKKINSDFIIVGSGLYGCVLAERISNVLKKNVIIVEKRDHIGGNCYSEFDKDTNIEYGKYGPHVFHTNLTKVWDYLNTFTKFNNYKHRGLSSYKNKKFTMPINLETINNFFGKNFNPQEAEKFLEQKSKKYQNENPKNFEEKALSQVGKGLYEAFFKNYTTKQWGTLPKNLPHSIFNRLPLKFSYDQNYFKSALYEGVPLEGYTKLFYNLIDNKRIKLLLNYNFKLNDKTTAKKLIVCTAPLDKLFNNKFGKLQWRSLIFKKEIYNTEDHQGTSVINYPELKYKFTRIYEPKHMHPERNNTTKNKTLIIKEYPVMNEDKPYYPINNSENRLIHRKYKELLKKNKSINIIAGGRLADYAYYDMDMTVSAALTKFEEIKKNYL